MIERVNVYMEKLRRNAAYAVNSNSRELAYQTYGSACTAYELGAITKEEFYELNTMLIYSFINKKGGNSNDIYR